MNSKIVRVSWQIICLSLLFLLLFNDFSGAAPSVITGKVIQVKDGDTTVIAPLDGGLFFTCRLYGIDTPETAKRGVPGQAYGEEAARELKKMVLGETVLVTTTGAKTYRREVCMIRKADTDINLEMVRRGYAWAYRQYLRRPYASDYIAAESEARDRKLGLWNESNPVPPWEFRKSLRHR